MTDSDYELLDAIEDGGSYKQIKNLLIKSNNKYTNHIGMTLLHFAAKHQNTKIVKLLLDAGFDPNIRDNFGWTPIMDASINGRIKNVRALLEAGADVNAKNRHSQTSLDHALSRNNFKIVSMINKYIISIPMLHRKFDKINENVIRESMMYV
jgi:ankyrin repeat protein